MVSSMDSGTPRSKLVSYKKRECTIYKIVVGGDIKGFICNCSQLFDTVQFKI